MIMMGITKAEKNDHATAAGLVLEVGNDQSEKENQFIAWILGGMNYDYRKSYS